MAEKKHTAEELEARVKELEALLVKAEPLRSLGALAGGVAHRFNNLLSVILGYASYVLKREDLSLESMNALKEVAAAAQKGRHLTDELLAFSTLEEENGAMSSVHETLQSVCALLTSQYHTTIELETELNAECDRVAGQASAVWQLVFSLLSNAAAGAVGGGRVRVSTRNDTVNIEESGDLDALVIEVLEEHRDGGRALSEEELRESNRLATMNGIVGSMQGSVSVSVEPEWSSTVTITLPVVRTDEEAAALPTMKTELGSQRIWVIDDDSIFCEMCSRVLTDEGHHITVIDNGTEFKKRWKAADDQPDLMIVDFSMADYNGLELCHWLQERQSETPVILVSGFSANQPDIKQAMNIRWTHFLQKPFSFQDLIDLVTQALGDRLIG